MADKSVKQNQKQQKADAAQAKAKKADAAKAKGKKGQKAKHPTMNSIQVACACGETFETLSTESEIKVEICSKCHPFFTGKQKFIDTAGRVERFRQKFGNATPAARKKKGDLKAEEAEKAQKIVGKG